MEKEIIAFKCSECKEIFSEYLIMDHTRETGHFEFEPFYKSESNIKDTIIFKCLACNLFITPGYCGVHRSKTNHTDFISIYKQIKEKENDFIR